MAVCTSCTPCPQTNTHQAKEPSYYDQYVQIAMKVSVIVLGIIAGITCPTLFVPFFLMGSVGGVVNNWEVVSDSVQMFGSAFCTQGFVESTTGVKLPNLINVFFNLALTHVHLTHHEEAYVPMIGTYVGWWAGKELAPHINWAHKQVKALVLPAAA